MTVVAEKIRWFQEVVLPCRGMLRGRIRRILPRGLDLDDVIAEVLARAYAVEDWRAVRDGPPFLTRIARNLLIDQARREAIVSFDYMADLDELGRGVSYEGMFTARDELRRLERIIDALPAQQRRVFLMRRVHGHSLTEIAAEMTLSVSTVEKHLTRALATIARETMDSEDYAGTGSASGQGGADRDRGERGSTRRPA